MKRIITKLAADCKRDAEGFLAGGRRDIRAAEEFFVPRIGEMDTELMTALYEAADQELLEKRAGRRHRARSRRFTTCFGHLSALDVSFSPATT